MSKKEDIMPIPAVNVDLDSDESMSIDEALARVAMILAKTENKKILSEVTDYEIRLISALFTIAKKSKNDLILDFLENFLLLRVSHKRKGRDELLKIAQSAREGSDSKMNRLRQLFTGGFR